MRILPSLLALLPVLALPAQNESKHPPPGAPWTQDFFDAHARALASGKPIFIYSTKTYCPHCVVMEKGLLSDERLQASYDDVVWMYLFQDFSGSPADRTAERVAIRFGITSWPQHFLVDPRTLAVLADTGRSLESFQRAVERARPAEAGPATTDSLRAADALAAQLEQASDAATLREHLQHEDVVVRFRALQRLLEQDPDSVVAAAETLLATPHDQIRFQVCTLLAKSGDPRAKPQLEALLRTPEPSKNPNVLRLHCVRALARCGDAGSIDVIAPHASSGAYFNSLTSASIDALVAIAQRLPEGRDAAHAVLLRAFPTAKEEADAREQRACRALAQRVHEALQSLTGEQRPFPEQYDAAARTSLIDGWR